MMLRPRIHDFYVGRTVLFTVLLTWAVLTGLDAMLSLSGEAKNIGTGSIPSAMPWPGPPTPCRAAPTRCSRWPR